MGKIWLIGMSLWFYGYNNPSYLPVILLSIVLNYGISKGIEKGAGAVVWGKLLLALGIAGNLGSIFYFKYYDFFLSNVNALFRQNFNYVNLVLPLGISFFTFQQISYLIDTYRGETKGYTFIDYALFVVFFPQLVAGPIVLHKEMIPQFQDASKKHLSADHMAKGLFIFSLGLFKKVILADTFGEAVDWAFDTAVDLSTLEAFAVSLFYTFQLYFDFSGYCDMAVGIGQFFQIHLPQNFNSPYKATSIVDFWSRWHMTLTRFLRSYVYFPLGGSKKGAVRTYLNIMIVFLVSGLWHGANWTFVLWGLLHGLFQCLTRLGKRWWDKLFVGLRWLITFLFVDITWILFRANDVKQAWLYIKHLFVWIYPTVWRDPI
ncbi:MAG: MBOAT family protein, partial [Lachnospiraceae bacterium]|nr:MBOAT family protein [Lachnospiraceae bacterium]